MKLLVDTNVLIRIRQKTSPVHGACVDGVRRLQEDNHSLFVSAQVLAEFWVVATRPEDANGLGLEPETVQKDLGQFEASFDLLSEPPNLYHRWRKLVTQHAVRGRPAHDAKLVALMEAHGLSHLLTLNVGDFRRYSTVTCVTPQDVLDGKHV